MEFNTPQFSFKSSLNSSKTVLLLWVLWMFGLPASAPRVLVLQLCSATLLYFNDDGTEAGAMFQQLIITLARTEVEVQSPAPL